MEVATATRPVRLTRHAVLRYRERVKPALSMGTCKQELLALASAGEFRRELPFERYGAEVEECNRMPDPDGYIELAPKTFAVIEIDPSGCHAILTILVDGVLSVPRRRSRNEAKQAQRRVRRQRRNRRFYENGVDKGRPKIMWQ